MVTLFQASKFQYKCNRKMESEYKSRTKKLTKIARKSASSL